ncbi:MAG TPA: hypothetical protein VMA31_00890 [Bryobacteraceae bacterium]|nr:hypothetical protein [Bryobacteraceae bacterium]
MAVIINELEVVIDPNANTQKAGAPATGGKPAEPTKPPLETQDFIALLDRERRNCLRVMAH